MNRIVWLFPLILLPELAAGTTVRGRFTVGMFAATERFKENTGGSNKNDMELISSRFYLKISEIKGKQWDVTVDLRDKNDFFDKLDRERLQLDARNSFQVRELDTRYNKPSYAMQLGRFPVQEAGAVDVDGGLVQFKHTRDWGTGVFAGLNPKREDQTYYHFNTKDEIFGAANTYSSNRGTDWTKNLYLSHAIVGEAEGSQVDRFYLFHNSIYQWNAQSRLISMIYLDTVPRTYVQDGNILWQQGWNGKWSSQLSLLAIDVITYSRRQGVRERLDPSPYKEASVRADYASNPLSKLEWSLSHGRRSVDGLSKTEFYMGAERNQFWSRHWDIFGKLGGRKNFTSDDLFANVYLGYFTRKWELGLDTEYGVEKYKDGITKHPITLEFDASWYLSRALYLTTSLEEAQDESVRILSGFFKLGYRFGSGEPAPLRDGSPPRGQL